MGKLIVIQPGGYHPFHAGHYALYQNILQKFPGADVYVAATNDTSKRPFPFEIKKRLAKVAGVKDEQFVQVKNPFQPKEILQHYDPDQDVLVFVRSEKDQNEHPKPGGIKKDGSPAYFQPYNPNNLQPFAKHGYIAYLPTVEFGPGIKSASEIRNIWPRLDNRKKLAMVMSLYPTTQKNQKLANMVIKLLDYGLGVDEKSVDESIIHSKMSAKKVRTQLKDYKLGPRAGRTAGSLIDSKVLSYTNVKTPSYIKSVVEQFRQNNTGKDYLQEK